MYCNFILNDCKLDFKQDDITNSDWRDRMILLILSVKPTNDWPQLQRAPIKFGRFSKLNNINVKVFYKQADMGFAAEAVFFGGGEGGISPKKRV